MQPLIVKNKAMATEAVDFKGRRKPVGDLAVKIILENFAP